MWDGVRVLLEEVRRRAATATCSKKGEGGDCKQAKVHVDASLKGRKVYVLTEGELEEIERRLGALDAARRFFAAILNAESGSRMFNVVSRTWNPVTGCRYNCIYCWARQLALTKLRNTQRYRDGFKPRLNPEEFKRKFKPGEVVFVSDMGDLWGEWVPDSWIRRVLNHISKFPETWFLFLTKNPDRYHDFLGEMPENSILGATIETNRDYYFQEGYLPRIAQAPLPSRRYKAMKTLKWPLKFISIEPIMDFDMEAFAEWIREISPFMVYIGYDNYNWRLPEPPLSKTIKLINHLETFTLVLRKTIRYAWNETLHAHAGGAKIARKA